MGLLVCASLATLVPASVDAQGFGKTKRKITLHRKLPAVAHLPGSPFTIRVSARDVRHKNLAAKLGDMIEAEITRNNSRLNPERAGGDSVVSCTINTVSTPQPTPVRRTVFGDQKQHVFLKVTGVLA